MSQSDPLHSIKELGYFAIRSHLPLVEVNSWDFGLPALLVCPIHRPCSILQPEGEKSYRV